MENIKILSKIGIGLALLDFLFRGFGPLYTTEASSALSLEHFIGVGIIPLLSVASSYGFLKGKKWGLYLGIVLVAIALIASSTVLRGGELNILAFLYLIVYGLLVFLGFQSSKTFK